MSCSENKINELNGVDCPSLLLTSGFKRCPKTMNEKSMNKTADDWLVNVKKESNIGPFWRVHDKLYDLTNFMDKHPGGKFWLKTTKGMDITEAFESAHIQDTANDILSKYFVKDTSIPRFSPFTFSNDGFYRTLKRKAKLALKGIKNEPSFEMKLIQDSLFVTFLSLLLYASIMVSYPTVILAGFFLCLSTTCAHNFFHQKDNWRMYMFDFSCVSSEDWRIVHAISHHLYPNTIQDFEIFGLMPNISLYPFTDKGFFQKYLSFTPLNTSQFTCFMGDYTRRAHNFIFLNKPFQYPFLIQPVLLLIMTCISRSFMTAFMLWNVLHLSFNFFFFWNGIAAGHHSHYTYVEGDPTIEDRDWGLHQIMAISERKETMNSLLLASMTFGNHTLHHLFPTMDHSKLYLLQKPFLETCDEFNINFTAYSMLEIFCSMFYRFYNNKPNDLPLKIKFNKF